MEFLEIGCSPTEEDCVQVGTENYSSLAKEECKRYIDLLRKTFGPEPDGARLSIKSFPHDYGSYYEVVCFYDDSKPASIDYAFKIESNSPERWE